ncbi:phospho-N-acetylmuramoyl-pentapeptide-transferase [Mobiluncus mulieris]|uniref:Phospho-N-acetylmuramoyl-pentapeptide-transferase n=2 Tax=Mobiluncus mulieris TaxID=2052 RepID=E0QQZ7_9ACTO|nr:phospho-N-acetylmuramoyl-pentapeptide-transferase [Mobiluncus mulieris]EEJ54325.1 phospho-N-acetylmuramoyl-pentapeptide-transferase [Mobiluncus mulieris ATCC 35243]EEZ90235.1 phospho-N-acetylmuramoyl-pentapeptide-transferase [Mobiluncus mulieris 28-1]EFM45990.1 phospho-N-acetylmuramoyl-pentapeptide-transferase [Mobiluncus mulieris ATCC 35239]EFN93381.1 phospho-N-acetylmuramoyl-pentapeptide-transferase [Mobiluncus mulieris FB024-16]MBB5846259.1 phospho-N-acetylmuramoyl-pentapeptide-transfera
MTAVLLAGMFSLVISLFATPVYVKWLVKKQFGQFIRQDGPTAHYTKRGTPTMGGVMIIAAVIGGWAVAHIQIGIVSHRSPVVSEVLLLFLLVGLGFIGWLDDWIKISKHRSLGLNPTAKLLGQLTVASIFSGLALGFENDQKLTPASTKISVIRDTGVNLAFLGIGLGVVLFLIWANFLVAAWSNAVNLTDGLDGLASGVSIFVFGGYGLISFWQFSQSCRTAGAVVSACYGETRDPLGVAIVCAAIVGALIGFLWWNASPARIFMGDTGSLALGGALAGVSIFTHTEFLAVVIGGLFVVEVFSDVIQVGFFKATRRRVFKMAPIHHHFELLGWKEITVVIRFWIIAGIMTGAGVGMFYFDWVARLP